MNDSERTMLRWANSLAAELSPDDERLATLLRGTPIAGSRGWLDDSEYFEWRVRAQGVEDDYLARALAHLIRHGHPWGPSTPGNPAGWLITAHRTVQRFLAAVGLPPVEEDGYLVVEPLLAVLTWLNARHEIEETVIRLRTACRRVERRAEFRGTGYGWSGPRWRRTPG